MSNRVRPREFQEGSGRLTRPREQWAGKERGRYTRQSPLAGQMQQVTETVFKALRKASIFPKVSLPLRKGNERKG